MMLLAVFVVHSAHIRIYINAHACAFNFNVDYAYN